LRLGLTCVRAFEIISKGVLDEVEAQIIGGVVHLLGMGGMAALAPVEMGGMVVLLLAVAEIGGTAPLPPLVEMIEVGEEGARLREVLGTLQSLDGRTRQADLVQVRVHAEIPTVMMVCLILAMVFFFPTINLMLFNLLN
jgi:predicted RNA-binding protein